MDALRVGQHALLVECPDAAAVAMTYRFLRERAAELGAAEVVPAALTVLLDGLSDPVATASVLAEIAVVAVELEVGEAGDLVEIPTRYDGPDLEEVARQWNVTTDEVVAIHQHATFEVAFCGFAPGFAYCTGLPEGLNVSRRAEPRAAVPPGSVALAGEYAAVYPRTSPGGWQLIGTTRMLLWRPDAEQPALLAPGVRVKFVDE